MYLVFDTETTGFPMNRPWEDPAQPVAVQLAAKLYDHEFQLVATLYTLLDFEVPVPEGAFRVHGISQERCAAYGMVPRIGLMAFFNLLTMAQVLVGHNVEFDIKILKACAGRLGMEEGIKALDQIQTYCTMKQSTDICQIPNKWGKWKWPTLAEAYKVLVDEDGFEEAHNALADLEATWELYKILTYEPEEEEEVCQD